MIPHFDRSVIMAVDVRFPDSTAATAALLRSIGSPEPRAFLNGRGGVGIDPSRYDLIHEGEPPAGWGGSRELWDYQAAYRRVLRHALGDELESLLVCEDDIELHPDAAAVLAGAEVPDDWQLLYLGCMHFWAARPAEQVAPNVVRLNGGQLGIQGVAWRPEAMRRLLDRTPDRPIDWEVAQLHTQVPSYGIHPAAVRQRRGVSSTITPGEPFDSAFIYEIQPASRGIAP